MGKNTRLEKELDRVENSGGSVLDVDGVHYYTKVYTIYVGGRLRVKF